MKKTKVNGKKSKTSTTEEVVARVTTPEPETVQTVESTETGEDGFNPFTDEAFQWMIKKSIPGAFPPILYCGPRTAAEISEVIGRPIELAEAQRLVQADGPRVKCALTGQEFQPVAYVYFCPGGLAEQIKEGATLLNARLPFGGQFYFIKGEMIPVSGSVFHYDEETQTYEFASSSSLVIMARKFYAKTGKMKWGVPLAEVNEVIEKIENKNKVHKKADALVNKYLSGGKRPKGLNPVRAAFKKDRVQKKLKSKSRREDEQD